MNQGVIGVNSIDGGSPAVSGKGICGWEISARKNRQPHRIAAHRQGLGLPHHRHHRARAEAVVIGYVGGKAIGLHLYSPVAASTGAEQTAINNRTGFKTGATRNFPTHVNRFSSPLGRRDPGPENH